MIQEAHVMHSELMITCDGEEHRDLIADKLRTLHDTSDSSLNFATMLKRADDSWIRCQERIRVGCWARPRQSKYRYGAIVSQIAS